MRPVDLWTGPLARASRLSAARAHLWMAGWTTLRVAHAPTHRPSAAHKLHRATPPRVEKSKTKRQSPSIPTGITNRSTPFTEALHPTQPTPSLQSNPRNPASTPKPVTMPKSAVTFAEIRTLGARGQDRATGTLARHVQPQHAHAAQAGVRGTTRTDDTPRSAQATHRLRHARGQGQEGILFRKTQDLTPAPFVTPEDKGKNSQAPLKG